MKYKMPESEQQEILLSAVTMSISQYYFEVDGKFPVKKEMWKKIYSLEPAERLEVARKYIDLNRECWTSTNSSDDSINYYIKLGLHKNGFVE
ncbi:hypothetical protein [Shewanella sp. SM29]|uniref:hypothetical protein n=1 Tax=Shewanella sp. SM29 TaxID=2912795 RepID=UPI0021DB4245|nr:hypothetical protein [Shewanella sp. SM29]MCU8075028.1 hypothetical protein [Shewanella sp. SM29]